MVMMPDGNIRKKSMRKAVERVDLGVFGKPMELHAWHRKKRSTWSGWAQTSVAQAAIGIALFTLGALIFGAPFNALTILLGIGFAVGCAIGDPISFLLWSIIFVELTGTISGVVSGAWFNLPSWWHKLAAAWRDGQAVSAIFVAGVPLWMFVWVAGGRGISKAFDILFERESLRLGFNVAKRYMSEEEKLRSDAYEESGVSDIEAQRHFDIVDRGETHAVIAGERPRIFVEPEAPAPAVEGGQPGYHSFFDDEEDLNSELSHRAAAGVRHADADEQAGGVDLTKDDASPAAPSSFIMETNLPAPPVEENEAPVQRAESPKLDARANRAMQRHMSQLLLSFESVMSEDELEAFVVYHRDVLMNLSEDQQRVLDAMDGGQALIAIARQLQSDNAVSIIGDGEAQPSEDLSILADEPLPEPAAAIDISGPEETTVQEDVQSSVDMGAEEDDGVPAGTSDVSALAGVLDAILPDRRAKPLSFVRKPSYDDLEGAPVLEPETLPASDASSEARDRQERPEDGGDEAPADPEPSASVPSSDVDAIDLGMVRGEASVTERADAISPVETDVIADHANSGASDEAEADDVSASDDGHAHGTATSSAEPIEPEPPVVQVDDVEKPMSISDGEFGFDVTDEAKSEATQEEGSASADDDEDPETVSAIYSRDEVLIVRGLLAANVSALEKAKNVLEFQERHPSLVVGDVVGSRSFVEHVGDHDAATVRHSWREVQAIVAAPPADRLGREFDRVNARGQKFLEEPHSLDRPLLNHWEQESMRLRRAASASADLLGSLKQHITINVSLFDSMKELLDKREAAAPEAETPMDTMPTVRQKVPKREDAVRGHKLLGSMFRGTRKEGLQMSDGRKPEADVETLALPDDVRAEAAKASYDAEHAEDVFELSGVPLVVENESQQPSDIHQGEAMSEEREPVPGEEGFVSKHPQGSLDYRREMTQHNALLALAHEIREEEEREANEARQREEARRIAQEAEDEASRARIRTEQEEAAKAESEERAKAARAERERAEAEAEEARGRAQVAAADARVAAAREASEKELRSRTGLETMVLEATKRTHGMLFQLPIRFHSPEILEAYIGYEELASYRKGLTKVARPQVVQDEIMKKSDIDRIRGDNVERTRHQIEILVGNAAKVVLTRIQKAIGAENASGEQLVDMLEEDQERVFVVRLQTAVGTAEKAASTLSEVEKADLETERLAEGSRGFDDLQKELREALARVAELADEKKSFDDRIFEANRERDEAVAVADKLRREMAGEADDEFQEILDKHAIRIDDVGVNGFYRFASQDKRTSFVIITAKAASFPDGQADLGEHSVALSEIIDIACDKAKTIFSRPNVLFVDVAMRPYVSGRNEDTALIAREPDELRSYLNIPASE